MPDPINPYYAGAAQDGQSNAASPYHQAGSTAMPQAPSSDPAVEMIRQKIRDLYATEPSAAEESAEAVAQTHPGSRHQQYMAHLNNSGISMAEIQSAWHNYYVSLSDQEKYEVWQEFYTNNGSAMPAAQAAPAIPQQASIPAPLVQPGSSLISPTSQQPQFQPLQPQYPQSQFHPQPQVGTAQPPQPAVPPSIPSRPRKLTLRTRKAGDAVDQAVGQAAAKLKEAVATGSAGDIKKRILQSVKSNVSAGGKLKPKHHLQSLAFGLGAGLIVIFIVMFGFFNELLLAPFIQPSRRVAETPVIVDVASTVVAGGPKVLIPKINVEIPVDYSQTTTDAKAIELALDKGIVHYPTTSKPGQAGNAAFFGHSSNNIFNPGKYKFAFVLLKELVEGDIFYLSNDGKTYAYKVFSKRVVQPTEVSVLGAIAGKTSTATLITCDPPGTSINRLVVVGEQISPESDPNNKPATPAPVLTASQQDSGLPGNGPTLWARIWGSVF